MNPPNWVPLASGSLQRSSAAKVISGWRMAPSASRVPCTLVWVSVVVSLVVFLPVSLDTKVMVTVILGLLLCLLQRFMGPIRRYSEEFNIQYAAMSAYYLPSVHAFYTANAIWSSSGNLYWAMWSIYLLMFSHGGRHEMRRYTLNAGGEQRWRLLQLWLYLAYLQWGLIWTDRTLIVLAVICFSSTTLSLLCFFLLIKPRVAFLDYNSKAIADYMRQELVPLFEDANVNIRHAGGKYPVIRAYDGEIITVSAIVDEADYMVQHRDICLSYSYCQLLARRYFGFRCAEEGVARVREFALGELLPDHDPRSYKRAFRIIEKQLAFLHDYFFTNHHYKILSSSPLLSSNNPRFERTILVSLLRRSVTSSGLTVAEIFVLFAPLGILFWSVVLFVIGRPFGAPKFAFHIVASLLLVLLAFFAFKPAMPLYWREIWTAFQNKSGTSSTVHGTSVIERYLRWCVAPQWPSSSQRRWQGQIGQYSLVQDYDSRSFLKEVIAWFKEQILCEESHSFIRHRPVEEYPVSLKDSVMERVARTLRDIGGPPTNGKTCLQHHGVHNDFGWTLKQETHTHTILIWHIATCYCHMFPVPAERTGTDAPDPEDLQVAVQLSKHCAYLVAFLPQLLPDHSLHTKLVLQEVLQEAKDSLAVLQAASLDEEQPSSDPLLADRRRMTRVFGQVLLHKAKELLGLARMSIEQKKEWIRGVEQSLPENVIDLGTTFQKGIQLGHDLVHAQNVESWELLADFWAETILYVAPSDNAAAHIELLAQGGQFVTQLWAFLSNAGIFKRETTNPPPGPVPAPTST